MKVVAVLPALDEEETVGAVVGKLVASGIQAVVVDNGSRDRTATRAREAGARVKEQRERGYGAACLSGVEEARVMGAEVVLFLDADGSDDPADAAELIAPIVASEADLCLGVRPRHLVESGAMAPAQRFGNWFAPRVMRAMTGARYSDMPPFKAISMSALTRLALTDRTYGFTIELMLRAHREGLRVREVPVRCHARCGGQSKVSGTVRGTVGASYKIIKTILHYAR